MTARESLTNLRRDLFDKLRAIDPETVGEIEHIDIMLAATEPSSSVIQVNTREFAGIKIIDAVRICLARARRSLPMPELVNLLISGGISTKGDRPAPWKISQSIGYHVTKGSLILEAGRVRLSESSNIANLMRNL